MRFFSGSQHRAYAFAAHRSRLNKSLFLVVIVALLSSISLIVHAAQLSSTDSSSTFGVLEPDDSKTIVESPTQMGAKATTASITIDAEAAAAAIPPSQNSTTVTVNNELVPVPANGTVSKNIESDDGQAAVRVQVSNQTTNSTKRSTIRVRSSSHTSEHTTTSSSQQVTNQGELQP